MKKILLILLIGITYTFASIGKITAVKGEVYIIRDTQQIVAKSGSLLELKDQVQTKKKAKALVLFNDSTSITVGNNSTLSVNEFVMDLKNPKKSKTNFGFGKGVFRTITGKIGKINPKGFKIKTKSASIGIRGTTLDTAVKILPSGAEQVDVAFLKGHGIITSDITGIATPVKTGQNASMNQNGETKVQEGPLKETKQMDEESRELEEEKTISENNKKDTEIKKEEVVEPTEAPSSEEVNIDSLINKLDILKNDTEDADDEANGDSNTEISEDTTTNTTDDVNNETTDDANNETTDDSSTDVVTDSPANDLEQLLDEVTKQSICTEALGCDHYEYVDYGYLLDDTGVAVSTYISGTPTPSNIIASYLGTTQTGNYSGKISAIVGSSTVVGGTIDLNMNFSSKNFTGEIEVDTVDVVADINSGAMTPVGFSTSDITSSDTDYTGSLAGKYYGPTAQAVGGTFNLNSPTKDSIIGVFGASK